jgi:Domain of unknown function (DUF4129)
MANYQKTSWSWQLQQLQQQAIEWLEAKFRQVLPKQDLPAWLIAVMKYLLWFLLIAGLAWVSYQIINFFWQKRDRRRQVSQPMSIPIKVRTVADLLADAQRFQLQRNYGEACRCLYLAMLQRLNDAKLILHQNSRTDREYAELLKQLPTLPDTTVLLRTHEQLQFADRTISADCFESCQQAYQHLNTQLNQQVAS